MATLGEKSTPYERPITEERLLALSGGNGCVTVGELLASWADAENDADCPSEITVGLMRDGVESDEWLDEALLDGEEGDDSDELDERAKAAIEMDDMVGLYLREISSIPLLTAQEEVTLAKRMERAKLAARRWLPMEQVLGSAPGSNLLLRMGRQRASTLSWLTRDWWSPSPRIISAVACHFWI
jgi:hypothetical protein